MLDRVTDRRNFELPSGLIPWDDFVALTDWMVTPPFRSKFGAMYLDQLDEPGEEMEWLIEGWLTCRDKSMILGDSKAGKTFIAIEMSLCVAFGRTFFGCRVKQGGVVYQAGEGPSGVKKRLRAWRQYYGADFGRDSPFVLLRKSIDICKHDERLDDLVAEIAAHAAQMPCPLRLVVIDTLAKATVGADENSIKDMGPVMRNLDYIQEKTGVAVMFVHHLSAGGKARGHTSVYANVEQVVLVTRDEQTMIRTMKLDKQKDEEEGLTLKYELEKVVLGLDEEGREVRSAVCLQVGERETVRREEELKGLRLSYASENFMRAFFDAERKYGCPVPVSLESMPAGVRSIVPWGDVKRIYSDRTPSDDLLPEQETTEEAQRSSRTHRGTMRNRIARHREELLALGVIGLGKHDGQEVAWHTGKALRAFKHTQTALRDEEERHPAASDPF